ncbi:MAG: SAM-dependent chlorinase/fluorinase [Sedimenticola sp.]|nr:SAM-dependent chlorinase/fluorinase [Sedimenticola sp.]
MQAVPEMVLLFTDFGIGSHYVAQVKARLLSLGVSQPVIELCSDAPRFNPRAAAYLLASFRKQLPEHVLYLAVVDPGVGTPRRALLARDEQRLFVAPDNGLLSGVARRSEDFRVQSIELDPAGRSRTFDGRDLFAPAAAMLCRGEAVPGHHLPNNELLGRDWPDSLAEVVYIDAYGNAVTGLSPEALDGKGYLMANGWKVPPAATFAEVPVGSPFWYINSNEMVEISVNQGSAADRLHLEIGTPLGVA